MKIIARIHTDFHEKFGIPRQSGLVEALRATVVFEPSYRNADALRGIDGFSHLWLIWKFSETERETWSPTVRPPRLGGNTRMGVFATRSPFRPNPIALSSVKLCEVQWQSPLGPVLHIAGADLMDGTPIYDIKPYLAFTDSHPDAVGGFSDTVRDDVLTVKLPDDLPPDMTAEKREALVGVLAGDPRPSYHEDPNRIYTFRFAKWSVSFFVKGNNLTVEKIEENPAFSG